VDTGHDDHLVICQVVTTELQLTAKFIGRIFRKTDEPNRQSSFEGCGNKDRCLNPRAGSRAAA
jgi:hypothetical protein